MHYQVIHIDPETMGGTPVFAGTRVPVKALFDYLDGGDNIAAFIDDFPSVSAEQIHQVLEMARKMITSDKVLHENFA